MNSLTEIANLRLSSGLPANQYEIEFDPESRTLWSFMNPRGTPCFSLSLLNDIRAQDSMLELNKGHVFFEGKMVRASYYVIASRIKGIFNLGGDLALFQMLIQTGDREALADYGRRCIDCIYPRIVNHYSPNLTTISLVQGDALGGGFETALSSDIIIAEESATLGLPEILFNLFPGMGAYSLLSRRIGMKAAEDLILSGRLMKATELHEMGIVDVLAADGAGEKATYDWIRKHDKRRNGMQAVYRARQYLNPITREEMDRIVDVWVDAAMNLEEKDLKMMKRLVTAQTRRASSGELSAAGEAERAIAVAAA